MYNTTDGNKFNLFLKAIAYAKANGQEVFLTSNNHRVWTNATAKTSKPNVFNYVMVDGKAVELSKAIKSGKA